MRSDGFFLLRVVFGQKLRVLMTRVMVNGASVAAAASTANLSLPNELSGERNAIKKKQC